MLSLLPPSLARTVIMAEKSTPKSQAKREKLMGFINWPI